MCLRHLVVSCVLALLVGCGDGGGVEEPAGPYSGGKSQIGGHETATHNAIGDDTPRGPDAGSSEDAKDGGAGNDGGLASTFGGATVCTSKQTWNQGNQGSPDMHPGEACSSCHVDEKGAPTLTLAGTIYPTGHEPNDCLGSSATGISIDVTDATGKLIKLAPNASGNFSTTAAVALPLTATVTYQGRTRIMESTVFSGDCNSCHTADGFYGAPGRIALP